VRTPTSSIVALRAAQLWTKWAYVSLLRAIEKLELSARRRDHGFSDALPRVARHDRVDECVLGFADDVRRGLHPCHHTLGDRPDRASADRERKELANRLRNISRERARDL